MRAEDVWENSFQESEGTGVVKAVFTKKRFILLAAELAALLLYGLLTTGAYSKTELVFAEEDMQLQGEEGDISEGGYLDASFTGKKAVVTPAFRLKKGIYYLEGFYEERGIAKAGLIYDQKRNGKELVDEDEFILNPESGSISYRVNIHDDSAVRFKIRLTGDAVDKDYVRLLRVHVVSSKLSVVCPVFCLGLFFLVLDLLLWGYVKYYKNWEPKRRMIFLTLAAAAFLTGLPLWQKGLPAGADLRFHLQRLEGVYKGLLSGQFPVRIQPGWLDGYGYASSVFYGDIFMYFPAFLRIVGFSLEDAYKCYLWGINVATAVLSFYAFRKIAKDDLAAMAGSLLYVCSTERLSIQYCARVGNYGAMMFYPLIAAGFYLIFTEDEKKAEYKRLWKLLAFGFTGLLMTHMQSCVLVGLYAVLGCLLMIRRVFRKEVFLELLKAVGGALLLNLWYLVPFAQYMLNEKLQINSTIAGGEEIEDYYVRLADFVQGGESLHSLFASPGRVDYAILLILLVYMVTLPLQKKNKAARGSRVILGLSLSAFWACTDLFPAVEIARLSKVIVKYFSVLQYQIRFISVAVTLTACGAALFFVMDVLETEKLYLLAGLLCCAMLYQDFHYFETIVPEMVYLSDADLNSRYGKSRYDYGIGNGEFLPVSFDSQKLTMETEAEEALRTEEVRRDYLTYDISVTNTSAREQKIFLPLLYYRGYQSYDVASGESLVTEAGDNGRVTVRVPANYSGTFRTIFSAPWYWHMAEAVSAATLVFILCGMVMKKRGGSLREYYGKKQSLSTK